MADFSNRTLVKTVTLPSQGLLYEGAIPDGQVRIAAFTTREEKVFAGSGGSQQSKLDQVFENCVDLPQGFRAQDLTLPDRLFLLVQIRALSYGEDYSFQYRCESCDEQATYRKNLLTDLPLKEIPEGFAEPVDVHLPVSGKTLGIRLLRGRDEAAIAKYAKKVVQRTGAPDGDPAYFMRLAKHIVTVDGEPIGGQGEAIALVQSLEGPDSLALRDAIDDINFGYQFALDLECPACGWEQEEVVMPITVAFFRPRRRNEGRLPDFA